MWNSITQSDNGACSIGRDIFTVAPRYHRIQGSNFRYTRSAAHSKVMEEKSKAEKAMKLAGVAYWVNDKHMMGDSFHKTAESSELSSVDTEYDGYPRA